MAVDLVLGEFGAYPPPAGGAVHLVLGETGTPAGTTDCSLFLTLRVGGAIQLGQLGLGAGGGVRAGWQAASVGHQRTTGAPWAAFVGNAAARSARLPWGSFAGGKVDQRGALPWSTPSPRQTRAALAWGVAEGRVVRAALAWGRADPRQRDLRAPWGRADPRQRGLRAPWSAAERRLDGKVAPWGLAALLRAPNRPRVYDGGEFGFTPALRGRADLHFCVFAADSTTDLVLGFENCQTQPRIPDGTSIAAKRSYVQTHSLTAVRLPDLTPVPLTEFSLAADAGSFCWSLSASGPEEVLTLLAPAGGLPTMIRVMLDGMTWEFAVEGLQRARQFGSVRGNITGRSISALLADPYSPEASYLNAVPVTAVQAIEEALFGTDLLLDWRATDWTIGEGAWSFSGTPMAVAVRVAESIGAIVQSPRAGDSIIVAPRYPILPWEWAAAAPDVTIALDAAVSDGYERADRAAHDGVYVSGQSQGVLALVKRTGSGPSLLLPTVTDPLITDLDAARQRGEALLGGAGPQARMTITLPVLTGVGEPGVIDVGKLVQFDGWKGLVRAVTVNASQPVVRQTLTIERHL